MIESEKTIDLIEVFVGDIANTVSEKVEACDEVIRFLIGAYGFKEQAAREFFIQQEMPHAEAHPGPGRFIIKEGSDGLLYPFYRMMDPENYTPAQMIGFIKAAGEKMSEGDNSLIEKFRKSQS